MLEGFKLHCCLLPGTVGRCFDIHVAVYHEMSNLMLLNFWNKFCSGRRCISQDWTELCCRLPKLAPLDVLRFVSWRMVIFWSRSIVQLKSVGHF